MATSADNQSRPCTECASGTQEYRQDRGGMWVCPECGAQSVPV